MYMKRRDRKVGLTEDISEEMLKAVLTAKPPGAAAAFDHIPNGVMAEYRRNFTES